MHDKFLDNFHLPECCSFKARKQILVSEIQIQTGYKVPSRQDYRRFQASRSGVVAFCALLECYTAYVGICLPTFDIHGSVHRGWFGRNINKMQLCNRIYYSKIYLRLNMFRAAHRSSSGALNSSICSLWFIYPCGDRPLSRLSGKWVYKPEAANTV